jgi:hypothetical protein
VWGNLILLSFSTAGDIDTDSKCTTGVVVITAGTNAMNIYLWKEVNTCGSQG